MKPAVNGVARAVVTEARKEEAPPSSAHHEKPRGHMDSAAATGVHSAIIGLLRDLPPRGTTWNPKKKQRFVDAFKAAIDHIYPEQDEGVRSVPVQAARTRLPTLAVASWSAGILLLVGIAT